MPNEFAFDPGGVADRSRWSSVAPSGNATPRHAALRRDASSTALRSVLPVSGEMGSLTDGLAPGRGAAEEHRIAERCDEEYEIPSTWFAFVPISCTLDSEIVYLPGSWGGKTNRHSHGAEPMAPRDDCACGA